MYMKPILENGSKGANNNNVRMCFLFKEIIWNLILKGHSKLLGRVP